MEEPVVTRFGVPAGFWRRGFADLLDAFVFALPMSAIIGVVMAACDGSATFMRAFGYALSVGTFAYVFAIGYLVYVTIMNSRIGGGATTRRPRMRLPIVAPPPMRLFMIVT